MKSLRAMIAVALLASPACLAGAEPVPLARLGQMEVRIFNARTGEWDPVYLYSPDFFSGWNWPGSSDDLEILVPVIGTPNSKVAQPLTVTVTTCCENKIVETRALLAFGCAKRAFPTRSL
jgi:hypothetical protein